MDERSQALIQAELDGELGSEQQQQLEALLEHSGEARIYQRQLRQLHELLQQDAEPEFPDDLHASILASVHLPKPKRGLASYLSPVNMHFRYGFAALATFGLALGVYKYNTGFELQQDTSGLVGTMMPMSEPGAGTGRAIDRISMSRDDFSAELTLRGGGDSYQLQLSAQARKPMNVLIDLGSSGLRLDSGGDSVADDARNTRVRIEFQGQKELTLNLVPETETASAGDIGYSWRLGDKVLESGYLRTQAEPEHN